ncbi:MAG: GumC family protein [Candidatus Sericytochromatia bacterium]
MNSGVLETPELHASPEGAVVAPGGLDLRLLATSLFRRWPLALAVTFLGAGAGWFASKQIQPNYQARTVLLRHNKNTNVNPEIYFEPNLRTLLETVKLRGNLKDLKRRLGLNQSDEDLFKAIDIQPGNRNDIIQIIATAATPQLAADMANGISHIFQNSSAQVSRSVAERVWRFRSGERKTLLAELQSSQNKLAAFQQQHGISFFNDTTRLLLEQIKQFELDQNNARLTLQSHQLTLAEMQREIKKRPENIRVMSTVRYRSRVRYDELQDQLKGLLEKYTETHPKVIALRAQLESLGRQVEQPTTAVPEEESFGMDPVVRELKIKQAELAAGLSGGEKQISSLDATIRSHKSRLAKLAVLEKDFENLRRDIDRVNENLRENDARLAEAAHAMRSNISSFDIVDPALPPEDPLPTRRKLLLLAGLGIGLILGLGLPLAIELGDFRLKSPRQFAGLGLEFLGLLLNRNRKSLSLYQQQWLLFVNRLLLRLEALSADGPRLLLVAGSHKGEGRSFVTEQFLDTLRFRGGQYVHIRPRQASDSGFQDLTGWLQSRETLLPFPLRVDNQVQLYTTELTETAQTLPLLVDKMPELMERHQQAKYLIWELPELSENLPWLLMLAPSASALLLVSRFRGASGFFLKQAFQEVKSLSPELPCYGLLNQVPWAYRGLRGA